MDVEGSALNKTFMEAAARLGVGVFASAPLQEGKLLQDSHLKVSRSPACCLALVGAKVASRCIALQHCGHATCRKRGLPIDVILEDTEEVDAEN